MPLNAAVGIAEVLNATAGDVQSAIKLCQEPVA